MWITNFKERKSFKIKKSEANIILADENIKQGRVINFSKYDEFGKLKTPENSTKKRGPSKVKKVWVSNLDKKICINVLKSKLKSYLDQGFINKRILNFDEYFEKIKCHKTVNDLKNEKKLKAEKYFSI